MVGDGAILLIIFINTKNGNFLKKNILFVNIYLFNILVFFVSQNVVELNNFNPI